jgi:hypothetical protein
MIKLPLPAEVRAKALALIASGMTSRAVADELSLALGTVKSWKQRQKKIDARPPAPVVAKIVTADDSEPIDDDLAGRQAEYVDRLSRTAVRFARFVDQLDGETVTRNADKILKCDKTSRAALKLDTGTPMPIIQIAVLAQSPAKQDQKRLTLDCSRRLPSLVRPQKTLAAVESESD